MQPHVNEEALAVREARKDIHRHAEKRKAKVHKRAEELRMLAHKLESYSKRADNLGEPDLSEDILTCAKFARKFAKKAAE